MPSFEVAAGRRLSYEVCGKGVPLVCHPGGPGFAGKQLGTLGGLDAHARLTLINPRGTTGSDPPADGDYGIDAYAADVEALRTHLELDRMVLFGHSHGGYVVARYAASHPERTVALILDGTPLRPGAVTFPAVGIAGYFVRFDDVARRYVDEQLAGAWEPAGEAFVHDELPCLDLAADATRIAAATLVIVGEQDFATGRSEAERTAGVLANATVAVIPDAGHFPWVEQPDAYRAAVGTFLAEQAR